MIKHSCPTIGQAEVQALSSVLKSKHLAQGNVVRKFEDSVVKYLGGRNISAIPPKRDGGKAVAVNSGSSALHLALLSLGVSKGAEVIIPSYVCSAVLNAVNYTGAKPVLADINENDFNLSVESVKKKITKRTRAIIVAHLFGFPAGINKFLSLGIPIIEDCAQSIGAVYHNKSATADLPKARPVGTFGKISVFSFYATKMLATGYGGMVISQDSKLADKIRDLIDYDNRNDYITRYNYQMSDLCAALGLSQLSQLDRFIQRRREIASHYTRYLSSLNLATLILPLEQPDTTSVFYRYVIRHPKADKIILCLNRAGIEAKKPVYKPLHRYFGLTPLERPVMNSSGRISLSPLSLNFLTGLNPKDFPNAEQAQRSAISLPIYPALTDKDRNYITDNLVKILKSI
ncbi:MAG: DegT/DnrJ/EryC1/StrS family aminotransferase [Planctomycetota bacterium]